MTVLGHVKSLDLKMGIVRVGSDDMVFLIFIKHCMDVISQCDWNGRRDLSSKRFTIPGAQHPKLTSGAQRLAFVGLILPFSTPD